MHIEKKIEKNRSLKELTTMGVGGVGSYYLLVTEIDELKEALHYAASAHLPYFVLGKGSNTLFDDRGFAGLVIHNQIDFFSQEKEKIRAGAGLSFAYLGAKSVQSYLSGLEFASGIPASVGGAIYMNASAHGHTISSVLEEVLFITEEGREEIFPASELQFSYRTSSFQKMKGAIASALFCLKPSLDAREREMGYLEYRKKTQPLHQKSSGCVFRNPPGGVSAGALIEKSGLKGSSIGGAKISEKHANFIVNTGGASCHDVAELVALAQRKVFAIFGVFLETEVCFISSGE